MHKFVNIIARNFAFVGLLCLSGVYSNCVRAAATQEAMAQRPEEGWRCYICAGGWQSGFINKRLWIERENTAGTKYAAHVSCIIGRIRNDANYTVTTERISVEYPVRKALEHLHEKYEKEAVRRKQVELRTTEAYQQVGLLQQRVYTLEQALQQTEARNVRYLDAIQQLEQEKGLLRDLCDKQMVRRRSSSANTLG
jgi:hypothetical protein